MEVLSIIIAIVLAAVQVFCIGYILKLEYDMIDWFKGKNRFMTFLMLICSVVILYFAVKFISAGIPAINISNNFANDMLSEDKTFIENVKGITSCESVADGIGYAYMLFNKFIYISNGWLDKTFIKGSRWLTIGAGIGLIIAWLIVIRLLCSKENIDTIKEIDDKNFRETVERNRKKEKKYSVEFEHNYSYRWIDDKVVDKVKTKVTDETDYEVAMSTWTTVFLLFVIGGIFLPVYTLVITAIAFIVAIIKNN